MAFETMRFEIDYGDGRIETTVVSASGTERFNRRLNARANERFNGEAMVGRYRRAIAEEERARDRAREA